MTDRRIDDLVQEAAKLRYSRRQILRRASALGLSLPAVSAMMASGASAKASRSLHAPALLQGTNLRILSSTYFVPEAQEFFTEQVNEWAEANGVDAVVDYVNWPDLQPKIGAAIQAGGGYDIVELWDTWPYLYYQSLLDVNDLASRIGEEQGGYFDWVVRTAAVDDNWYSIPHGTSTSAYAYRKSYFEEAGAETFPETWEELFEVGARLKEMGKPLGQALGHSLGDPPSFGYAYMWSNGSMEVEDDGTTVVFNQPQFVEGMRLFVDAWDSAFDTTGLSWDDSVNNRAFLSDEISATLNGSSIYLTALKEQPDIAEDMDHAAYPAGPAGRFNLLGSRSMGILKDAENVDGARAFLEWWFQPEQFQPWLEAQEGYFIAPVPLYLDNAVYTADPKLAPYAEVAEYARNKGYAGPANQDAAQVFANYIITDTFAKAVQTGNAEQAIEEGAQMLKRIYER